MNRFFAVFLVLSLGALACGFAHSYMDNSGTIQQFRFEQATMQRLSNAGVSGYTPVFASPRIVKGVEMIDAFIEIKDKSVIEDLKSLGVIVNCEFDGFVTSQIPVALLDEVSWLSGVTNVEISKVMEFCTDQTLSVTRADQVINGINNGLIQDYDGTGVIVGIIDSGFDYQHYVFRNAEDGSSRITRVYDTENATGHPVYVGTSLLSGSVFMGEQIDTLTTDTEGTHGTHTASIAAGTHYQGYGGMAPGAEIVLCASRGVNAGINQTEVANCMKYIYAYADSVGKPCVISLSVSLYNGVHDGLDFLARAIAQSVGQGRVFVIAAGNNAGYHNGHSRYVCGPSTVDRALNIQLVDTRVEVDETDLYYHNAYYSSLWTESWSRKTGVVPVIQFHILDKLTRQIVWESSYFSNGSRTIYSNEFSDFYEPRLSVDSVGYMQYSVVYNSTSRKYAARCGLYNLQSKSFTLNENGEYDSRYQIGLSIYPPKKTNPNNTNDSIYIDSWVNNMGLSYLGLDMGPVYVETVLNGEDTPSLVMVEDFYAVPSDKCTINSIAVNDSVISAGSFAVHDGYYSLNRDSLLIDGNVRIGDIYYTSSYQEEGYGPVGQALPTVCAPGVWVVAAGSRYSYFNSSSSELNPSLVMIGPNDNLWGAMTGTSMASPTVAGIIAQWLQINPNLSPGDIKAVIAATAIKDNFTVSPHFGPNGKIDALAGARYLLAIQDEHLVGDVNNDGVVSIKDVTVLIDCLLSMDYTGLTEEYLDVNQDGTISIKDVTDLIDMLLSGDY